MSSKVVYWLAAPLLASAAAIPAAAQPQPAAGDAAQASCRPQGMFQTVRYKSVEQLPDGRVTFRLCAPEAQDVSVTSSDFAVGPPSGGMPVLAMTRDASGLWSATTAVPVPPDTYRFNFQVDGARVPDPLASTFSHERTGTNSTFETVGPQGAFQAYDPAVPHGAVTRIEYWSETLGQKRPAMVYTPPGYMNGSEEYPVLYLVHGAGDSADSWTSVGKAHYILDNLIAAGKAKPMIVVMPFGHTPERPNASGNFLLNTDFGNDLIEDLIPYVDANFRTLAEQENRAMAGLSMGGSHTMQFGLTHPELFDFIGIFSMGLGLQSPSQVTDYEAANGAALRRAGQDLDLVYYAMGKDDFLYGTVTPTRGILTRHGVEHVYHETDGGHTWINWRRYLADFAPRLFR